MPATNPDDSLPARVLCYVSHTFGYDAPPNARPWKWYTTPGSGAWGPRWRLAR